MRRCAAAVAAALALGACTAGAEGDADRGGDPSPTPTAVASPSPTEQERGEQVPALAPSPAGDVSLWLDTIGIPVVAAVRTSTELAQLEGVSEAERVATCRRVAADLDGIASPQVLSGLAITADAETATLLVGDLRAKGDLLAVCLDGGPELDASIDEVARTHAVAVAWLERLRGQR